MFHALTSCDTVTSFVGHGKKTAWTTWNALPKLTDTFLTLSCAPSEDVMHTIERFVILLYDRTNTCTDIHKARRKLSPTRAALEQHVKRATYQGGHIWGQSLLATPALPLPTSWGWMKTEDGLYESNWTTLPEASKACYELVSCKVQEGLCETLQMQEGCTWVHAQLWRGVFTELTMCTDIISVIW